MEVGIFGISGGRCTSPEFVGTVARVSEDCGFAALWQGEHVVLFEETPASHYPYATSTEEITKALADPTFPCLDPVISMTWAAAVTKTIRVATAVVILPQRNPVVLAKQIASLDSLSNGRVVLGVGVGWCREEYDAIGVPWENRGQRTDEYIEAMRALWKEEAASYHGDLVNFDRAYCYPKPSRDNEVPIIIGGETKLALDRAARLGDGWVTFSTTAAAADEKFAYLKDLLRQGGRDPDNFKIIVDIFANTSVDDLKRYRDAGATEFNLVVAGSLPTEEKPLISTLQDLSEQFRGTYQQTVMVAALARI